jgi:hypothetical protein
MVQKEMGQPESQWVPQIKLPISKSFFESVDLSTMEDTVTRRAMGVEGYAIAIRSCDIIQQVMLFFVTHFRSKRIKIFPLVIRMYLPKGLQGSKMGDFQKGHGVDPETLKNLRKSITKAKKNKTSLLVSVSLKFPIGGGGAEEDKKAKRAYSGHANMLLIDGENRTISIFEPHGRRYSSVHDAIKKLAKSTRLTYTFDDPPARLGQGAIPLCATFSLFTMALRYVNPAFPSSFLFVASTPQNVIKFLAYLATHVPALFDCHVFGIHQFMRKGQTFERFVKSLSLSKDLETANAYMERWMPIGIVRGQMGKAEYGI